MHKPMPRRRSFLHEEVHPTLTHGAIALAGFLFGILTVGALAVNATDAPTPSLAAQVEQLKLDVAGILTRLAKLDGGGEPTPSTTLGPISTCESLMAALPKKTEWADSVVGTECTKESIVGVPQKKFLNVSGRYQYPDNSEQLQEVTLQIFDLDADSDARDTFLTKAAYEATDFNKVKRLPVTIKGMDGWFTYEGLPVRTNHYIHGADWFVYKERWTWTRSLPFNSATTTTDGPTVGFVVP